MAGNSVEQNDDHANVVFTFGRFQPPTIGHKVLIDFISTTAASLDADPYVFVSSSQNKIPQKPKAVFESTKQNENPLSVYDKVSYLKKMYPETSVRFINTTECECTTIFKSIDVLKSAGYTGITMAVGSDRVESFQRILSKVGVTVIAAGDRVVNVDSTNAKAMSGTKMRQAAVAGNVKKFTDGVMIGSMTEVDAMNLLNAVRAGLGYDPLVLGGSLNHKNNTRKGKKIRIKTRRMPKKYRLRLEERT